MARHVDKETCDAKHEADGRMLERIERALELNFKEIFKTLKDHGERLAEIRGRTDALRERLPIPKRGLTVNITLGKAAVAGAVAAALGVAAKLAHLF